MTLSLCMIVKNEAVNLPRALASVRAYVDEIIVLDTGSTDDTRTVATSLGATVHDVPWMNDFAAARNASLEKATGDWIFVLDADETLTERGREILQILRVGTTLGDVPLDTVLLVNFLRYELDAEQAPYSAVPRLFRNHPDIRFNRPYHETVDDSVAALMQREPQWQVVTVPQVALEHTGYQADAIAQGDKFARAETIMAAYLASHPEDAYICNKLGALYGQGGDWEKGRPLLNHGLQQGQVDPLTTYELHYHLGLADSDAQLLDQAAEHYRAALAQPIPEVLKLGAHINLGSVLKAQKDFMGATEQFEIATQLAPEFAIAHYNLGIAYRARGYLDEAIAAYRTAIALQPTYAEAHQNLGVALFKLGQLPQSLKAFQRAIAIYQHTNPAEAERLQQNIRSLGISPG